MALKGQALEILGMAWFKATSTLTKSFDLVSSLVATWMQFFLQAVWHSDLFWSQFSAPSGIISILQAVFLYILYIAELSIFCIDCIDRAVVVHGLFLKLSLTSSEAMKVRKIGCVMNLDEWFTLMSYTRSFILT